MTDCVIHSSIFSVDAVWGGAKEGGDVDEGAALLQDHHPELLHLSLLLPCLPRSACLCHRSALALSRNKCLEVLGS